MLASLGIIFLSGLLAAAIFKKLRLPRILGMLTVGVLFGSHVLNIIDPSLLAISADLRKMALVIILIKAGLSLDIRDLKKVGRPALLMSFLPAMFEITAFTLVSPLVLGISRIEGAVIGSILGAVSPAVVVPKMVQLMEDKYGMDKSIPQLILAGASLDDVFNIVLFSTFAAMAQGGEVSAVSFVNIPVSIVSGIIVGTAVGFAVTYFFEICLKKNMKIRSSTKVIVLLAVSFLLTALENALADIVSFSGLLSVISMSCVVGMKSDKIVSGRLKDKFGK
ncbi:MAG: cation:proton antiporter, partial [Clostridia bacterium]|nr:cation:proton antiporter [Clostridia bacterium]